MRLGHVVPFLAGNGGTLPNIAAFTVRQRLCKSLQAGPFGALVQKILYHCSVAPCSIAAGLLGGSDATLRRKNRSSKLCQIRSLLRRLVRGVGRDPICAVR